MGLEGKMKINDIVLTSGYIKISDIRIIDNNIDVMVKIYNDKNTRDTDENKHLGMKKQFRIYQSNDRFNKNKFNPMELIEKVPIKQALYDYIKKNYKDIFLDVKDC